MNRRVKWTTRFKKNWKLWIITLFMILLMALQAMSWIFRVRGNSHSSARQVTVTAPTN